MENRARDELIELRGLRFHYREWPCARPDAPELVLLHGYTSHARSWDRFAAAMSADFRVLALDQRGHGESQWAPADAYATQEMVSDLQAFVAALGLRGFSLLGLSMGGIVAFGYAGQRPPELSRLVIVDIAPEVPVAGLRDIQTRVARGDVFDSPDEAFAQARLDNPVPPDDLLRHRVDHSLMRTGDGRWTWRYDRALRDPTNRRGAIPADEGWQLLAQIGVPTLVIRGAQSALLPRELAERMIEALPDGRLVEVAGAGHPVPLDRPEEFLTAARAFLVG